MQPKEKLLSNAEDIHPKNVQPDTKEQAIKFTGYHICLGQRNWGRVYEACYFEFDSLTGLQISHRCNGCIRASKALGIGFDSLVACQ